MISHDLTVLIPVLARPHRVKPVLDGFYSTVPDARIVMLADMGDSDEISAILSYGRVDLVLCESGWNYARKINCGVERTNTPLLFLGADDLEPEPEWFENACEYLIDDTGVVGVNDMLERPNVYHIRWGGRATHFLVTRSYARLPTLDGKRGPLPEDYAHGSDTEFVATARRRNAYKYAVDSHVRHLHPRWMTAPWDDTYWKGENAIEGDMALWRSRRTKLGI